MQIAKLGTEEATLVLIVVSEGTPDKEIEDHVSGELRGEPNEDNFCYLLGRSFAGSMINALSLNEWDIFIG